MRGFIGGLAVSDYANITSGQAQGVRALYGMGGLGVRVGRNGLPPVISHIITETTTEIINTENSQQFITESS